MRIGGVRVRSANPACAISKRRSPSMVSQRPRSSTSGSWSFMVGSETDIESGRRRPSRTTSQVRPPSTTIDE
jgi:hypothetical protein